MKLKTSDLKNALLSLAPVAKIKPFVPIQSCVKIQTFDRMELTSFSSDEFMVSKLDFNGEIAGIAVNYIHFLNSIGDSEETSIIQKDGALIVRSGQRMSRLSTVDVNDFPDLPDESKFKAIGVRLADLAIGIRAVHGFEHKDRDNLVCTNIKGTAKAIECLAGTGRELAVHTQALISADFDYIVPSAFCDSLADALEAKDAILSASERMLYVKNRDVEYFCKMGEGKYPSTPYTQTVLEPVGIIDSGSMISELTRCLVFKETINGLIQSQHMSLEFSKEGLRVGMKSGVTVIENKFQGEFEAHKCKVNVESFLKCLKPFKEKVKISANENMLKLECGDMSVFMGKTRTV